MILMGGSVGAVVSRVGGRLGREKRERKKEEGVKKKNEQEYGDI